VFKMWQNSVFKYKGGTSGTLVELFFDLKVLVYNNNIEKQVKVPTFFQTFHLLYIIYFHINTLYRKDIRRGDYHNDRGEDLG